MEIFADKPARVSRSMDTLQTCGIAPKVLKCKFLENGVGTGFFSFCQRPPPLPRAPGCSTDIISTDQSSEILLENNAEL